MKKFGDFESILSKQFFPADLWRTPLGLVTRSALYFRKNVGYPFSPSSRITSTTNPYDSPTLEDILKAMEIAQFIGGNVSNGRVARKWNIL